MLESMNPLKTPKWQLPPTVKAAYSTRSGGVSDSPWASFNLSATVGDDEGSVGENRFRIHDFAPPPSWLQQAHSAQVIAAEDILNDETVGDAVYTFSRNVACAVTTADCLPILLCAQNGSGIAAVHAGWRGLAAGIIDNTVNALRGEDANLPLLAWIGPAICRKHYEVGKDVYESLCQKPHDAAHFDSVGDNKWHADLPALATTRMQDLDIEVTRSDLCTYGDARNFYSARRDGKTGRSAALIWME